MLGLGLGRDLRRGKARQIDGFISTDLETITLQVNYEYQPVAGDSKTGSAQSPVMGCHPPPPLFLSP